MAGVAQNLYVAEQLPADPLIGEMVDLQPLERLKLPFPPTTPSATPPVVFERLCAEGLPLRRLQIGGVPKPPLRRGHRTIRSLGTLQKSSSSSPSGTARNSKPRPWCLRI